MAKYRVIAASVNIHAGVLGLEPHQARARLHRLKQWGNNRYEIIDPPVTFKRGEEFEYAGELPKTLVESVASCAVPEEKDSSWRAEYAASLCQAFPPIDAEIATEAAPDDGVAEKTPKRKKGARGPKPAA